MRIPTLAVCTLAAIAAQDLGQSAHALPASESTPEVNPRVVPKPQVAASLLAVAVTEPIADVQIEFSPVSPAVAQTTTIDQLEGTPTEPPPESPPTETPPAETPSQPGKATEPITPDRSPETTPPGSSQYLQEESPASPAPTNSSPTPAPISPSSPTPSPSGLSTEPIAPTIQIGTVTLPHRGALPARFVFPIRIRVTVDSSITTNTPITNSTQDLATWEERVRACLDERPQIFAVQADGALAPILFDGQQGRILRNANGRMVCSAPN